MAPFESHLAPSVGTPLHACGSRQSVLSVHAFDLNYLKPVCDASKYSGKAELLAEYERCHKQVADMVASADEAKLAEETPDPYFRQVAPTLSDAVIFILIHHTAAHLGQIAVWRRAHGLSPVLA